MICTDLAAALLPYHVLRGSTTHLKPRVPPLLHTSLPGVLKQVMDMDHRRPPSTLLCSSAYSHHLPTLRIPHRILKLFRRRANKFRGSSVFLLSTCNDSTQLR